MNAISKLTLAVTLVLSSAYFTLANAAQPAPESAQAAGTTKSAGAMSEGEIKKIDKEAGKVTIKHGPLTNLNMPAMTMNFRVKDPVMLDKVKVGSKIFFVAENIKGKLTVVQLGTTQAALHKEHHPDAAAVPGATKKQAKPKASPTGK